MSHVGPPGCSGVLAYARHSSRRDAYRRCTRARMDEHRRMRAMQRQRMYNCSDLSASKSAGHQPVEDGVFPPIGATKVSPKIRHDANTMATFAKLDDDRPASRKDDAIGTRTTQLRKPCGIAQLGNLGDRPGTSEQLLFATNVTECPAREPGTRLDFNGPKRQFSSTSLEESPVWEPRNRISARKSCEIARFGNLGNRLGTDWEPQDGGFL